MDQGFFQLSNPENTLLPSASFAVAAIFGAIIGSFLNVVIHRLPLGESIIFPASHCPSCDAKLGIFDNIPILSYLILWGRCRACRMPISPRYPAVELLTAILYAFVFRHDGWTLALPFDLVFVSAVVVLIFIDAEHMILPNAITYPGLAFAVLARLLVPNLDGLGLLHEGALALWPLEAVSLVGAIFGALVGGGSLWLTGWIWERLRGVEAMGLGDVKMMLMVGAYLGWPRTVLTIFLAVLTGSLVGILLMLRRGERDMQMLLPFGIFLGLAAIISLLVGETIIAWYLG
ncbi:MAG: prepilin peptidase [Pyrinomonadaceae bacterium]|nr:prepilin peptidase [Pyrinomonadaceae bacterium]